MDVRCDRCETEYELDDAIVTDAGASVQCTTCGHTFVVTRRPSSPQSQVGFTPPSGLGETAGPDVPEWTLSTDDGRIHRFRDLNTLQKWIVERKVTRSERISRAGGPWLALGEVVELAPFFSVVDEADRARASGGSHAGSSGRPGYRAARSAPGGTMPRPTSPDAGRPVSEDGPTVPNRRLPGMAEPARAGFRATESRPAVPTGGDPDMTPIRAPDIPAPGLRAPGGRSREAASADVRGNVGGGGGGVGGGPGSAPAAGRSGPTVARPAVSKDLATGREIVTAEVHALESDFLRPGRRGRNLVLGVFALALAVGGGYWWLTEQHKHAKAPETVADKPAPGPSQTAVVVATTTGPVPHGGGGAAAVARALPSAKSEAEAGRSTGAMVKPAGSGAPTGAVAAGAGGDSGSPLARGRGDLAPASSVRQDAQNGRAGSNANLYDRLVADADRLLERGKSAKADKLYAQALAARPDGVAALTGSAYVLLDRQRHFRAIETFRRALAIQPTFGPALFGIAESYRARGDSAQALGAYRQYLAIAPTGADAPAARRQIKDLEAAGTTASPSERSAKDTSGSNDQDRQPDHQQDRQDDP